MHLFDHYPFVAAWFGAGILYVLNLLNNRQPFLVLNAVEKATRRDLSPRSYLMVVTDLFVSSGLGCLLVMLIFDPTSAKEATMAGLGLTGILSAFGKDA